MKKGAKVIYTTYTDPSYRTSHTFTYMLMRTKLKIGGVYTIKKIGRSIDSQFTYCELEECGGFRFPVHSFVINDCEHKYRFR